MAFSFSSSRLVAVGMGLIGGSLALGLRRVRVAGHVVSVGRSAASSEVTIRLSVIDEALPAEGTVYDVDMVVLRAPIAWMSSLLLAVQSHLGSDTIVMDAGSTKSDAIMATKTALGDQVSQSVPAYPIVGRELNGVGAAPADLCVGKKIMLCPLQENHRSSIARVQVMWEAADAYCHIMSIMQHDAVLAAVGRLSYILSYTLVARIINAEDASFKLDFAGGGFRDFTRITVSSLEMQRNICLSNRDMLLRRLTACEAVIGCLKTMTAEQDGTLFGRVFRRVSEVHLAWPRRAVYGSAAGRQSEQHSELDGFMGHPNVSPLKTTRGTIKLPGSKSISNCMLLLAVLAQSETVVCDPPDSDGTHVMFEALGKPGVSVGDLGDNAYHVTGTGGHFPNKSADLLVDSTDTAIHPLTAALVLQSGKHALHDAPCMHERLIDSLVDGLHQVGTHIDYTGNEGCPSLTIHAAPVKISAPIRVRGGVLSQFLMALPMALPSVESASNVTIEVVGELTSRPYIEIVLNLMTCFGVQVVRNSWSPFTVPTGVIYKAPDEIFVEGDASPTSYFLVAGVLGGGPTRMEGVGMSGIQGNVRFADALSRMGANVMTGGNWIEIRGVERDDGRLHAVELGYNHIPDVAMTLAVAVLFVGDMITPTNVANQRARGINRLTAMATELHELGAEVEEGAGYIRVTPPSQWTLPVGDIDIYSDCRMTVAFSLVAFGLVSVRISDPRCIGETFSEYLTAFDGITT